MSIVLAILVLIILPNMFARVPAGQEVIIERLGKFHRLLKPGIHGVFIPFVDRAAQHFSTKPQEFDIPKATPEDLDGVPITVACTMTYQIVDCMKIYGNLADHRQSLTSLTHTAIQSVFKDYTWFEAMDARKSVQNAMLRRIEDGVRNWGIKVTNFEVLAMNPPDEVLRALEAQAKREKEQWQREQQGGDQGEQGA